MDNQESRTPREKKIRRAIVFVSSCQTSLGAVLISMSFTVFASSSSDKIRSSCPYWAGFTVLFTGAVGFLTWKQLSIISIGIYTFLSAASVIVHLVATVLTGDTASFLKSLHSCEDVSFEHACQCCLEETDCKSPYKFPSVRDCSILNGFIKDVMYGLCAANVVCCLICLMVTVMGCTLVAQYSRYSQAYRLRLRQRPTQDMIHDHRYNWFPFSSDPIASIPPCAPPIYYPAQNNPQGSNSRYRRPPVIFDPVDFPPPYSSREPSLCETLMPQEYHRMGYTLTSQGSQGTPWDDARELETEHLGTVEVNQGDYIGSLGYTIGDDGDRELSSTSGAVLGADDVIDDVVGLRSTLGMEFGENSDAELYFDYLQLSLGSQNLPSSQRASSGTQNDDVFTSASSLDERVNQEETGTSRFTEMLITRGHVRQRRHSCPQNEVYSARDEVYRSMVAKNVNPWGRRTMSEQEALPVRQQRPRAKSNPCYTTVPNSVLSLCSKARSITEDETSGDIAPGARNPEASAGGGCEVESGGLFRHFKERKATKCQKRSKRPRNNPDHILERESETSSTAGAVAKENCLVSAYKETVL